MLLGFIPFFSRLP